MARSFVLAPEQADTWRGGLPRTRRTMAADTGRVEPTSQRLHPAWRHDAAHRAVAHDCPTDAEAAGAVGFMATRAFNDGNVVKTEIK